MTNATGFDWNAGVIEGVEPSDNSPNKIVTRTLQRIAAKGFQLLDCTKATNNTGFNWGRSSYADNHKTVWSIVFEREGGEGGEFSICLVVQTITYHKRNPYDRAPKENGKTTCGMQADNKTKQALGWEAGR
jgi:hypothetical protein